MSSLSTSSEKLEKLLDPSRSRMMPPSGLQVCLQPCVNLTFDLCMLFYLYRLQFSSHDNLLNDVEVEAGTLRSRPRPNLKRPNRTLYFTVKIYAVQTLHNR